MTEQDYYDSIRELMEQRGIGGVITRKELIEEMIKRDKPGQANAPNHTLRANADRCLSRLRFHGFLAPSSRGRNKILKILPNIDFLIFTAKYPTKYYADRKRKSS